MYARLCCGLLLKFGIELQILVHISLIEFEKLSNGLGPDTGSQTDRQTDSDDSNTSLPFIICKERLKMFITSPFNIIINNVAALVLGHDVIVLCIPGACESPHWGIVLCPMPQNSSGDPRTKSGKLPSWNEVAISVF
jgi:hypothetical protein